MKLLMLEGKIMTNTEINKRIAELESQIKSINEYVYNIAIGEVTMGYRIDASDLAAFIYEVTGIDAEGKQASEVK